MSRKIAHTRGVGKFSLILWRLKKNRDRYFRASRQGKTDIIIFENRLGNRVLCEILAQKPNLTRMLKKAEFLYIQILIFLLQNFFGREWKQSVEQFMGNLSGTWKNECLLRVKNKTKTFLDLFMVPAKQHFSVVAVSYNVI